MTSCVRLQNGNRPSVRIYYASTLFSFISLIGTICTRMRLKMEAFVLLLLVALTQGNPAPYDILKEISHSFDKDELVWTWTIPKTEMIALNPNYETQSSVFGCNQIPFSDYSLFYSNDLHFIWKITRDEFDPMIFVEADLKLVHYITGLYTHLPVPNFQPEEGNLEFSQFEVAFSLVRSFNAPIQAQS